MSERKDILLSICIPTYNRLSHVNKIVGELLKCNSNEFNIFVIDNCSTNGEKLMDFHDDRVHYILRDVPVDGRVNLWDSLRFANGEYCMFCIDRDMIFGSKLEAFLETLRTGKIRGGICVIDKENTKSEIRMYQECGCLNIYGNLHPSGNFVRRDVISEEYEKVQYANSNSRYYLTPFMNDFVLANAMIKGKFLVYDTPLVYTAMTMGEKNEPKSSTYSPKKGNLYFMPKSRVDQMNMDIDHLNTFSLEKNIYVKYLKRLISNTLNLCTLSYKSIMSNPSLCEHYYIETKQVDYKEIKSIILMFKKNYFINESINLNLMQKHFVYKRAVFRLMLSAGKRKMKQILKGDN